MRKLDAEAEADDEAEAGAEGVKEVNVFFIRSSGRSSRVTAQGGPQRRVGALAPAPGGQTSSRRRVHRA